MLKVKAASMEVMWVPGPQDDRLLGVKDGHAKGRVWEQSMKLAAGVCQSKGMDFITEANGSHSKS